MKKTILSTITFLILCMSFVSAEVFINEFLPDGVEWAELYNDDIVPVDISNWNISDEVQVRHTFPDGTILGANGYILVNQSLGLNNGADTIYLHDNESTLIDSHAYTGPGVEISIGRKHDGLDDWVTFTSPTPNAINNILPEGTIPDQTIDEDNSDYFTISSITDADSDPLTFIIVDDNEVDCNIQDETNVTLTPAQDWNGTASCTIQVNDGYETVDKQFNINVNPVNDAPIIISEAPLEVDEDSTYIYDVEAEDVENDALKYILLDYPCGMDINRTTGLIDWTPSYIYIGELDISVMVYDDLNPIGGGGCGGGPDSCWCTGSSDAESFDIQNFTLTVNEVNDAPNITAPLNPELTFNEGSYNDSTNLDDYVNDEEDLDEDISWSAAHSANLIVDITEDHVLNISAVEDWFGEEDITLTATDSGGASSDVDVKVIVSNVNDAPYFTSTPTLTAIEAIQYNYNADADDIDSNIDDLEFSIVSAPNGAVIDISTGVFTWTPTAAQFGNNQIELEVEDSEGGSSTQPFNVIVLPVLDIINIEINGQSVEADDTVSGFAPGDTINVQYEVKNRFPDEANNAIVGIETNADIGDYSLTNSTDGIILEGQETEVIDYTFQLPHTANIEFFDLELSAEGIDLYTNPYSSSKTINLVLDRDFHRVEITNQIFSENDLTCSRDTTLTVTLVNTGNWSEEGTVTVYNENTGTDETKTFTLGIAEEDNIVFDIDATEASSIETFSITVKYFSNYYTEESSIELTVNGCLDTESLNAILKVNESTAPSWSPIDLKDYTYGDTAGLDYQIVGEDDALIDCDVTVDGMFSCGTAADDLFGISVINMSIGSVYEQFNVEVLPMNDAPVITGLLPVEFSEGESSELDLNDYVSDPDNTDEELSWNLTGNGNITVSIDSDNVVTFGTIDKDWYGGEEIIFTVEDPEGLSDSETVTVTVNQLFDDVPYIKSFSPDYDPLIGDGVDQELSVVVANPDSIDYTVKWYVNGIEDGTTGDTIIFHALISDIYEVVASVENASDVFDSVDWIIEVSDEPFSENYDFDYLQTLGNATDVTIEQSSYGKIDFGTQTLDLSDVVDIDRFVNISKGVIGIDSDNLPALDTPATITLYGLSFQDTPPIYYNEGFSLSGTNECLYPICDNIQYNTTTGTLTFEVWGFSIFWVPVSNHAPSIISTPITKAFIGMAYEYDVDATDSDNDTLEYLLTSPAWLSIDSATGLITGTAPNNLSSEEITIEVKDGKGGTDTQSFTLTVKEPEMLAIKSLDVKINGKTDKNIEDGETIKREANPESDVQFRIEVENTFPDEVDLDIENILIEITIRDIDDSEDLEEEAKEFDLRQGKDKKSTITFKIPLEVDEGSYDVEIHVEGEDENGTTHEIDWIIFLEVEKEKHEIKITKSSLNPEVVGCEETFILDTRIINLGREDEDEVVLEIRSIDLGVNFRKGEIELDEGSKDNDYSRQLSIRVPDELGVGIYPIIIDAYYDPTHLSDSETVNLEIKECQLVKKQKEDVKSEPVQVITIQPEPGVKEKEETTKVTFTESEEYIVLLIILFIITTGLVIFIAGVTVILLKRR